MPSVWFDTVLLDDAWAHRVRVSHSGGVITAIDADVAAHADDERASIGVPGLCNAHSHAFQRGMAGFSERRETEGDDFWSWRQAMYRFVDGLDPCDVEAVAALAYVEMLESGFTRVGEFHYLHHDRDGAAYTDVAELAVRIAAAADSTGIGLTLLPVFYAHSGFGAASPRPEQRRFVNSPDTYAALVEASRHAVDGLDDAIVGVAPHSLRAVTPDELALILPLAVGGPIHIHIAEQMREVGDCIAWSGRRPVEWLLDTVEIDPRWCLVHATHLTDVEAERLAQGPAVVGLCPITEANLGDGLFPAARFMEGGGRFAIGSDSNVLIDAAEELRLLEYGQRLGQRRRIVLASKDRPSVGGALFRAAQAAGGQALGVGEGGIQVGASADMVSLDAGHPALLEREGDALLDGWLFATRGGAVDCVWRRGRKVVVGGRHVRRAECVQGFARALNRVLRA